ncbi:MAG: hypothetical protein VZQ26_05510 [Methanomethylophilus sp.]|nr:hypothetical protein [Methanomethylophilus sp.]
MIGDFLEIGMLLCFAASWPFNIRKSYLCRTAVGKSIAFELIIEMGYFCGVARKFVIDEINYVLAFYILDIFLVAIDMALYFRNRRLDAERLAKS